MLRDIPSRGNEEIDLYMRTYYSLLRSTSDIRVRSLEETHCAMDSSLHIGADEPLPDISASACPRYACSSWANRTRCSTGGAIPT
jgi:hypothetical protein